MRNLEASTNTKSFVTLCNIKVAKVVWFWKIPLGFDLENGCCQVYLKKVKALHVNRKPRKEDKVLS